MRLFPDQKVDAEFKTLRDDGRTGTMNDMQRAYLLSRGYSGSLADMIKGFVPVTGPTPGATATIVVNRSDIGISPDGVVFTITGLTGFDTTPPVDADAYDPEFHDVEYYWDFDDSGSTFTKTVNTLPHQKDANVGYGRIAAHTYTTPGTYNPTCLIYEPASGKYTTVTTEIVVADPDTVFTNVWQNVYVDPDGDFSWVPSDHLTRYNTLALAFNLLRTRLLTIPYRIILRDGKVHSAENQSFIQANSGNPDRGYPNIYIVGEGTGGTKPEVNYSGGAPGSLFAMNNFNPDDLNKDFVISGVNFTGDYREANEGSSNRNMITHLTDSGNYVLLNDVEVDGLTSVFTVTSGSGLCTSVLNNVKVTNWAEYAFFHTSYQPSAYLGVHVVRQADALSGGARNDTHNDGTCWRFNACSDIVIDGCEAFNRCGWVFSDPGYITQQPVLRWNGSGIRGTRLNLQRSSLEGGSTTITCDEITRVNVQNVLIERNIIVGASQCYAIIFSDFGGLTVRNNLMTFMDAGERLPGGDFKPKSFVRVDIPSSTSAGGDLVETLAGPIKVVNNTMMSEWTAAEGATGGLNKLRNAGSYPNVTEDDNVLHDPFAPVPETGDGPFTFTDLFAPRDTAGLISAYERVSVTLGSSVANGGSFTVSYNSGRSSSDYSSSPAEPHEMFLSDSLTNDYDADIVFGGSDMTVTNNSGTTWTAGTHTLVLFCPDSPVTLSTFGVITSQVRSLIPASGSPSIGSASTSPYRDFYGSLRGSSPSQGAFEEA